LGGIPPTRTISIDDLPEAAAAASLQLRGALLAILGDDLVSMWVHGGTTFADRPTRPGDLDIVAVIAKVDPGERTPRTWRADPGSRPSRVRDAEDSIAEGSGLAFDSTYLLLDDLGERRQPPLAFHRAHRETSWAVSRAHWLAGQYVLLHGRPPEELFAPPTSSELRERSTASSNTSSGTSSKATPTNPTRRPTRSGTARESFTRSRPATR
jgi:hypothetical protein